MSWSRSSSTSRRSSADPGARPVLQPVPAGEGGDAKLRDLLLDEPSVEDPDARDLPPIEGEIALEAVTFGYDPDDPVLRDVDLAISRGETFSLVGPDRRG